MTRQQREEIYSELKANAPLLVRCGLCNWLGSPKHLDPHHVNRRHGDNLFVFIWLHRECHDYVETHPAYARENGLLAYTYDIERRQHELYRLLQGGEAAFKD